MAEARGALEHKDLADARIAKGQPLPARAVAVAPSVATAAAAATQTWPTTKSSGTTLAAIVRDAPLPKRASGKGQP